MDTKEQKSEYAKLSAMYRHTPTSANWEGELTILICRYGPGCHWSIPLTVAGKDGAAVCGERCEPSQCEGAILCVLHGDVPLSSQRSTGKGVASDHPIALCSIRGGPRECHAPCSRNDHKIQWWTSWSWGREVEHTHMINSISHPLGCLGKPANLTPNCETYISHLRTLTVEIAKVEI